MIVVVILVVKNVRVPWIDFNPHSSPTALYEHCEQVFHWDNLIWIDCEVKPAMVREGGHEQLCEER